MDRSEIENKWRGNFNAAEFAMFKNDLDNLLSSIDVNNPYYPFGSELEWLNYNNSHTETMCNIIINYNGRGKFGSEKLQKIADKFVMNECEHSWSSFEKGNHKYQCLKCGALK